MRRVLIVGAGGRDFHDFNVVFRDDPEHHVVAFTAAQIPGIDDRRYPASLAGLLYPDGIPIRPEAELEELIRAEGVDEVVLSYSDLSHDEVMHIASRALAAGADFRLLGPDRTMLGATKPVVVGVRGADGQRQEPDEPPHRRRSCSTPGCASCSFATRCPTATSSGCASSASRRPPTSTPRSRRSRSARSTRRPSRPGWSSTPASTTPRSSRARRRRRT